MSAINHCQHNIPVIILSLICLFLTACKSWSTPIESDSLSEAEAISIESTTLPTIESSLPLDPLPDFPLTLGTKRVYTASHYDTLLVEGTIEADIDSYFYITDTHGLKVITATYHITETVTNVQLLDAVYVVDIFREQIVVSTTVDFDSLDWERVNYLDGRGGNNTYTYVISGTNVFKEANPDLGNLDLDHYWLEFVFPLQNYATWHPNWEQRMGLSQMTSGTRFVEGPLEISVPGGSFKDCFKLVTSFHSGPSMLWFCNGVGMVKKKYDHHGTPYGYEIVLVNHNLEQ
jgi:hypothetical protein